MKKIVTSLGLLTVLALGILPLNNQYQKVSATSGHVISTNGTKYSSSLPTYIDLNPVEDNDIRDYYKSLNSLSESERKGTNLLKNLKKILKEMNYYNYGSISKAGVTQIYTITDRDWEHSPASTITGYDSDTNTISNYSHSNEVSKDPYIHMLYVDYEVQTTTKFKNGNMPSFDKEHVWCQSRGFKADSGAEGPAGTDLHHLIAGDSQVNQDVHNDIPYGFVDTTSVIGDKDYTNKNKNGSSKHTSSQDKYNEVFEPQDDNKGDIARAIFYMAARYNNYAGTDTITQFEPNLEVVNYISGSGAREDSSATHPVGMGILRDLLAWNKLDPVSDYEIHRNDLIYRNYQGNRNPFIDFPEWADYIWGTVDIYGTNYDSTITNAANPATDSINDAGLSVTSSSITLNPNQTKVVKATTIDNSGITWTIDNSEIVDLDKTSSASGEEVTVKALKLGSAKITVKATVDSKELTRTIKVNVVEEVKPNYILYIAIGGGVLLLVIIVAIVYAKGNKKTRKAITKTVKKAVKSYSKSSSSGKKKSSSKKK